MLSVGQIIPNLPKQAAGSAPIVPSGGNAAIPPYGKRANYKPRDAADFGDGGAFPEVHHPQYPLGMGKKAGGPGAKSTLGIAVNSDGSVAYDSIAKQGTMQLVHARPKDVRGSRNDIPQRPEEEEVMSVTERTRAALEAAVNGKIAATRPAAGPQVSKNAPTYVRFTPAQSLANDAHNSGAKSRIIRMVETQRDPLEPPKFKHKRVPGGPPSPPVPVMHSPPRKLTAKEQAEWKIAPCISNWKNPKGYTIPLDKRLAADGRGLQTVQINDNFAQLSEVLYLAERNVRSELEAMRAIKQKLAQQEKAKKEEMLQQMASDIRSGLTITHRKPADTDARRDLSPTERARLERESLRDDRKRERERDKRMSAMSSKKSKTARDGERDISEQIALGQKVTTGASETQFDQRLFNQSQGMDSGFGAEDSYSVYDKALFAGSSANMLYRPNPSIDAENYGVDDVLKADRFKKPHRGFDGTEQQEKTGPRDKPVEFEADPFGLEEFLNEVKTGKAASALDSIGASSSMHAASAGGAGSRDADSFSRRKEISFSSSSSDRDKNRDRDRDRDRDRRR
eukprot:CAMPEP_0177675010 /NCGR_PEP_ID=MMETSP0447-20121125/26930_1 /TAXON_ID=0 /ORGANISM="Stygamoeba regulata, Strain BSH-02190019" /LENGTH=566 /DNA_ID=CAMNT_0019183283 /DNA_START=89 /DNA_END=1789 /DNA_ORIENTATION=+